MVIPKLVAHRGYPLHYPENTAVGIEAAIAAGARFIEVDIQFTSDGVPVLFHDRTLERLCGVEGTLYRYTAEQIRHFSAGEFGRFGYKFTNTPIMTLAELVQLLGQHPDVTAFIELKRISIQHFGIATVVSRVLRDLKPVAPQCVIISYSLEALRAVRGQGWSAVGAVVDKWQDRKRKPVQDLDPTYLFCGINSLPRRGQLRFQTSRLAVFESVDAQQALQVAEQGVEFVETFAIGEMLSALATLSEQ